MRGEWALNNVTEIIEAARRENLTVGEFLDYIETLQESFYFDENIRKIFILIH